MVDRSLQLHNSHCPWVGNCIGERNHRFFFMFLLSISGVTILTTFAALRLLFAAYQAVGTSGGVGGAVGEEGNMSMARRLWLTIMGMKVVFVFGSFTLLCAWSLTSLLFFHAMIISAAQTTNERVRGVYRFGSLENVADKGCLSNWRRAFCSPLVSSRLPRDFAEPVVCRYAELDPETEWIQGDALVGVDAQQQKQQQNQKKDESAKKAAAKNDAVPKGQGEEDPEDAS